MNVVTIYTEGKRGSHDFDVINQVIGGLVGPQIVPIGGKKGAKAVIQTHEKLATKSDYFLFFRDRDFDQPLPDKEELTIDGYTYFSYKTTIENYFLNERTLQSYFQNVANIDLDVRAELVRAAKHIQYHQAVRMALGKLRVPTDFGTNIATQSGQLPSDLSPVACKSKGWQLIAKKLNLITDWNKANFDQEVDDFVAGFDDNFYETEAFTHSFQGKDLAKSLSKLNAHFNPKEFYTYAKSIFDYQQFADLVQLRAIVKGKLQA